MTTASAPGKIILFGEHAVVYGHPALAVPVTQVRTTVEVLDSPRAGIQIYAPDVNLHTELKALPAAHPLAAAIWSVFSVLKLPSSSGGTPPDMLREGAGAEGKGLHIKIESTIPVASGLGSGAAVSAALIRALSAHLGHPLADEQVSALAFEVEKLHHGTPSGIDNTVVTYARPVYFIKGQPIKTLRVGAPFTLVIGDTGIPAPTKESVGDVRHLWAVDQARWGGVFDQIGQIAEKARGKIENGEVDGLGNLMNRNHALLQELTVSSPELDNLVAAARAAGALGAKLSGGGRGGNMIALVQLENAEVVSSSLKGAGAKDTIVTQVS
jgi:mevalonate kinase